MVAANREEGAANRDDEEANVCVGRYTRYAHPKPSTHLSEWMIWLFWGNKFSLETIYLICSGQITTTSHDQKPQRVAEEGKSRFVKYHHVRQKFIWVVNWPRHAATFPDSFYANLLCKQTLDLNECKFEGKKSWFELHCLYPSQAPNAFLKKGFGPISIYCIDLGCLKSTKTRWKNKQSMYKYVYI